MTVYMSGDCRDCSLPAWIQYWHKDPAPGVMVWTAVGYMACTSLVWIDSNLNADQYISDILCPVVVAYLQGLLIASFQQDNARPHVALCVLTFFNTQGI